MPRYVVERLFSVKHENMPQIGSKSRRILVEEMPEIVWEHSHVVVGEDGTPKSFCIYDAPNIEMVREHAEQLGDHFIVTIYEIAGDVTPDDFPLTADPVEQHQS
jgi:hypothetical protein